MNLYFKNAELHIKKVISELSRIIDTSQGEDLECYNPCYLDDSFQELLEARTAMALGAQERDK